MLGWVELSWVELSWVELSWVELSREFVCRAENEGVSDDVFHVAVSDGAESEHSSFIFFVHSQSNQQVTKQYIHQFLSIFHHQTNK